jgi:hypothetical protein
MANCIFSSGGHLFHLLLHFLRIDFLHGGHTRLRQSRQRFLDALLQGGKLAVNGLIKFLGIAALCRIFNNADQARVRRFGIRWRRGDFVVQLENVHFDHLLAKRQEGKNKTQEVSN